MLVFGYPDKWRDYSGLVVDANDAYGNRERSQEFEYKRALAKFGQPVDVTEWCMNAQLVKCRQHAATKCHQFPGGVFAIPQL